MTKIRKSVAALLFGGGSLAGIVVGGALVQDVKFAHAAEEVQATREQLNHVESLATVFREVGKVVEPSVVMLEVRKASGGPNRQLPFDDEMLKRFFPDTDGDGQPDVPEDFDFGARGTGSGVIMETQGNTAYILTNNHVAGGATEIKVTLADGRVIETASIVGTDAKTDLAVVKVDVERVMPAKWGNSDELQKGDWIVAFGSPFGYVGSMTHGIVSALNRDRVGILGSYGYENFIQVDAPINPGNSGGPLVNVKGEVVGINTAIASRNGGFQGIGFAIPSNQAKFVYTALKEKGKVTRGWLGVSIMSVSERASAIQQTFNYPKSDGVLVMEVMPKAPVFGKLENGDIITELAGKPVKNVQELRNQIAATPPNTDLKVKVFRKGENKDLTIRLGEQPDNLEEVAMRGRGGDRNAAGGVETTGEVRGMKLTTPTDELAEKYGLTPEMRKGALITEVKPRSGAFKAGLLPGDVITEIAKTPVTNAKDAAAAIAKQDANKILLMYVTGPRGARFVFVEPTK